MKRLQPELLLQETRSGLVELEYYGYIVHCDKNKKIKTLGKTNEDFFFHRSCAKPLQASIIDDFDTKDFFNLSDEEIAVCCASHTGTPLHQDLIISLLKKAELNIDDLQCPIIEPLSLEEQKRTDNYTKLHNNCSAKHALMLAVCRQNGWHITNYLEKEHPLQIKIYEKIKDLCESGYDLPFTLDGCTAPNFATTLEDLTKGFWNLFFSGKYPSIQKAFEVDPMILGGEKRLDTQIMQLNNQLKAKVGAGGLCSVINKESKEALSFKIIDADMKARSIIVIETLIKIGWLDINSIDENLLKNFLNKTVTTETGQEIGEYRIVFDKLFD